MGLTGITDNLSNSFAVARLMTSKFPSVVILAELAEQLRQRQAELGLVWDPRDQNEEANALTSQGYGRFREDLRVRVDLSGIRRFVLNDLTHTAELIYEEVKGARELKKAGAPALAGAGRVGKRRLEERLRARSPW